MLVSDEPKQIDFCACCLFVVFFWLRLKAVTLKDDGRWAVVPNENWGYLSFADPGVIS